MLSSYCEVYLVIPSSLSLQLYKSSSVGSHRHNMPSYPSTCHHIKRMAVIDLVNFRRFQAETCFSNIKLWRLTGFGDDWYPWILFIMFILACLHIVVWYRTHIYLRNTNVGFSDVSTLSKRHLIFCSLISSVHNTKWLHNPRAFSAKYRVAVYPFNLIFWMTIKLTQLIFCVAFMNNSYTFWAKQV